MLSHRPGPILFYRNMQRFGLGDAGNKPLDCSPAEDLGKYSHDGTFKAIAMPSISRGDATDTSNT
ncbi:MAG: hypothetical protein OSA98_13710 [Rubripirellula sp.]|nr:hypothetical protein [Rubripirellula sp.]